MDPSTHHTSAPGGTMGSAVELDGDRGLSTKRHIEFNPRVVEEGATTEEEGEEELAKIAKKKIISAAHNTNT